MDGPLRILLFADSHLGFDLPARPRVARRRRGDDFLVNYARALEPALEGAVDLVVHGGDVFHRPRVARELAHRALGPLLEVADRGVPVFMVPGNHERGRLPPLFLHRRGLHVFDRPRTFSTDVRGMRVALSGFPYERRSIRTRFGDVVCAAGGLDADADVKLLCVHHCVEGATVGPGNFTFTTAQDVIRCRDIPPSFAAVLSGHIHRRQVLTTDLRGRPLASPVLYPGSIERTATAEIGEPKGYFIVEIGSDMRVTWSARPLYARPMLVRTLDVARPAGAVRAELRALIANSPEDAVLRIRTTGEPGQPVRRLLAAGNVRALAPATMNVDLTGSVRTALVRTPRLARPSSPQLDLLSAG